VETGKKSPVKVVLRQIGGYACIAAGIAGCILPIIPGIPLLFVGLGLLSVDSQWAARLRDKLKEYTMRQLRRQRGADSRSTSAKVPSEDSQQP
jgi:uncharacterized protein